MNHFTQSPLKKDKFLTDDEYTRLHNRMLSLAPHDKRNAALILTAMHTGARASEILRLTPKDLDAKNHTLYITGLKGSNDRELPIPAWLSSLIRQVITETHPQEKHIYAISYPRLDQIWHSCRTCKKKFHGLRHTFAVRQYKHSRDIKLVQWALGHKSIMSTMIYADFVYRMDEAKAKLLLE